MNNSKISLDELKSLVAFLPDDFLEEFLRTSERPNDEIDKLFELQELVSDAGEDYKKTIKCILKGCTLNDCAFYHRASDMRRNPSRYSYDPKPCFSICINDRWEYSKRCPRGDNCNFSHNQYEINLHPNYKQMRENNALNKESHEERRIRINEGAFNDLISEIKEIDEIIERKKENLLTIQYDIEKIQKFAFCMKCCKEMLNYILPCGHLLCESCKNGTQYSCPVCLLNFKPNDVVKLAV